MKCWNHACGEPWAMTEPVLSTLLSIAAREHSESIEAISAKLGKPLDNAHRTEHREGVAIIPVIGPLFRYANMFTHISGASSYEIVAQDFITALENPAIRAIVFNIDSPGGEVNGCAELASLIYHAKGQKPILAYASGDAASGAYWIASACDEILVSETAMLGSIGVVAVYQDQAKKGTEIVSSQSPFKRTDPSTDEGKRRLQSRIDQLADVFIRAVATHRAVDVDTVERDFGSGDVFVGQHAIDQGMADQLSSLEQIITTYSQDPAAEQGSSFLLSQEHAMTDTPSEPSVDEIPVLSVESLKADHPAIVDAIQAQAIGQDQEQQRDAGRAQERQRIGAILTDDYAQGREGLAHHLAFETELPVDMVLSTLQASPKKEEAVATTDTGFEKVMASLPAPDVEPDQDTPEEASTEAFAKRIAQAGNQ